MTRLPLVDPLDGIRIANPCTVPWDHLSGDDRVRFCGKCRQNVYNVAAMGRDEARALIMMKEMRVCLRLIHRADGTLVTADCWTRLRQARQRGWLAFCGMIFVLLWAEIAAQIVGLSMLGRLRSRVVMGEAPHAQQTIARPTPPKPTPAMPMPRAFETPTMGLPPVEPSRHIMGKMAPSHGGKTTRTIFKKPPPPAPTEDPTTITMGDMILDE
jgi:hypothetical protein